MACRPGSLNIFAILRGEIPCKKICEDQWALAFQHQPRHRPRAGDSKGQYVSFADFSASAKQEIAGLVRAVGKGGQRLALKGRAIGACQHG